MDEDRARQGGRKARRPKLAVAAKQPRANRKLALPGTWEKLFPPHPAVEREKLALYDARIEGKALAAPLGRVLPLRPIHELFADAWQRAGTAATDRPATVDARDWIAELRAAPHDDALRAVYGDYLAEHGDPLGELVAVQLRRAQLGRAGDARLAELADAEQQLLAQHGDRWTEAVHPFIESYCFDRGVLTSITVRAPSFVKHAAAIATALPLLEELVLFTTNGIGPIPAAHVEALVGCREFGRIRRLDFTPDHYLSSIDELTTLLGGEWLPHLRYLRLGYHRQGNGFGTEGARLIAECTRLDELRFLEVPGNNFNRAALTALFESPTLARLEVLRVPYSGLTSNDVDALADKLEAGALPALRVLDVSNILEADNITKACSFYRNRVGLDRQQRLLHVLASRRGAAQQYASDANASARPQGGFTGEVREQTGRFPYAEEAKSGTSRCIVCREKIAIRTLRIGVERMLDAVGLVTSWVHPDCRTSCPELRELTDLDERLRKNSRGVWPPS